MGLFKSDRRAGCAILAASILVLSWSPHIFAKYSHSDCDDVKIRTNIFRVCHAYPTLKRSTSPLHDELTIPLYEDQSPDSVLYNFPRSTDYNSEIESYVMPILSNPNLFQQVNAMAPTPMQPAFYSARRPLTFPQNVYNPIPPVAQQQNSFLNWRTQPDSSSYVRTQNNAQPTYFNNPYNTHNLGPWLGSPDMYSLSPVVRWRRDETMKELQSFVNQCCAIDGCPFPKAYVALDKKINLCKRR